MLQFGVAGAQNCWYSAKTERLDPGPELRANKPAAGVLETGNHCVGNP